VGRYSGQAVARSPLGPGSQCAQGPHLAAAMAVAVEAVEATVVQVARAAVGFLAATQVAG
jgi:hypothetical protein